MRGKASEFSGKLHSSDKITYGFKSRNCPPIVHEFENFILNALGKDKCLNKKTEFINKCRHQNKLLLKNVKDSMDWNLV